MIGWVFILNERDDKCFELGLSVEHVKQYMEVQTGTVVLFCTDTYVSFLLGPPIVKILLCVFGTVRCCG